MPFTLDDILQYGNSSKVYSVRSAKVLDWVEYIRDYKHYREVDC